MTIRIAIRKSSRIPKSAATEDFSLSNCSRGWDKARMQQYSLLLFERRKMMISWFFNDERQK